MVEYEYRELDKMNTFLALHKDKSGAAFIEYTALLGVILAVGLAVLTAVGTWAGTTWTSLCSALSTSAAVCTIAG